NCVSCSQSLDDRPCIRVEYEDYCFKCAKEAVKDHIEWVRQDYQRNLKSYERRNLDYQKQFQAWLDRKERAFSSKMDNFPALGLGVVCGFVGNAILPIIGAFFGFFVGFFIFQSLWELWQAKLNSAYRLKCPPPIKPNLKPPSNPEPIQVDFELDDTRFSEACLAKNYRRQILMRDKYVCQNCGEQKTDPDWEVHHIQTQANGGPDHPTNLITLCKYCHDRETWFDHRRMFPTTIRQRPKR